MGRIVYKIFSLLLCIIIIVGLVGCTQRPQPPRLPSESETEPVAVTTTLPTEAITETTLPPTTTTPPVPETTAPVPPTTTTPPETSPPPAGLPDISGLDQGYNEWYNIRNSQHTTPGIPGNITPWLNQYNGIYLGSTEGKNFYLTFDCGADSGYATSILDTLKARNVTVTFFVTGDFITNNPDLIKRMVNEGHLVANHTVHHPALPKISPEEIRAELEGVEQSFSATTGQSMIKYMRPPMGAYSQASLAVTSALGYKTVFWSIAYRDYDVNNQPTPEETMTILRNNHHNGAVFLLHVGSKTNAETLNQMLDFLQAEGYSLNTLP